MSTPLDNIATVVLCLLTIVLNAARAMRKPDSVYRRMWIVTALVCAYEAVAQMLYLTGAVLPMLAYGVGTAMLAFVLSLNAIIGHTGDTHD